MASQRTYLLLWSKGHDKPLLPLLTWVGMEQHLCNVFYHPLYGLTVTWHMWKQKSFPVDKADQLFSTNLYTAACHNILSIV